MSSNINNTPDCDDQLPTISSVGHDVTCEKSLHSRVGATAIPALPTHSTIGRGPMGPVGPPPTTQMMDDAMRRMIIVVPADQWPPVNRVDGVLYLKAGTAFPP